jgi:hypothetical protein
MAVGFTMAACGETEDEAPEVRLTIIDFDFDLNGWLVEAEAFTDEDVYLFAVRSYNERNDVQTLGEISNRRVTLEVWEHRGGVPVRFTGDIEDVEFTVYLYDPAPNDSDPPPDPLLPVPNLAKEGTVTVTFRNGAGIGTIEDVVVFSRP